MSGTGTLYEKYDLDRDYDNPEAYGAAESYFGDGKYPPDWGADREDVPDPEGGRRDAVLQRQAYRCARCGRRSADVNGLHVHHYYELHEGGGNELDNLVALCADCHHLMHPWNDEMAGDLLDAPMFPHEDAQKRVATVRKPVTEEEREREALLSLLSVVSNTGANEHALSAETFDIGPRDAIEAKDDAASLVRKRTDPITVEAMGPDGDHLPGADVEIEYRHTLGSGRRRDARTERGTTDRQGRATFRVPKSVDEVSCSAARDGYAADTGPVALSATGGREEAIPIVLTGGSAAAATAPAATGGESTDEGSTGVVEAAKLAVFFPLFLLGLGVKWLLILIVAPIALSLVFGPPILALKWILEMWTTNPLGLGFGLRSLATLALFVVGSAWAVFWIEVGSDD